MSEPLPLGPRIDPLAVVHPGATVGAGTRVWQFCVVMDGAVIEDEVVLGADRGYALARRKNVIRQRAVYTFCQKDPAAARRLIR